MKWFCKTCEGDLTKSVEKFRGEKKILILVCSNGHASRLNLQRDGVGEEEE